MLELAGLGVVEKTSEIYILMVSRRRLRDEAGIAELINSKGLGFFWPPD